MELTAVDILIMGASISTILGFIVAGITLRYLYLEKIEKLEYETKNTFLSGQVWTNKWESNNKGYFELSFSKAPPHRFSGNIICFLSDGTENLLMFDFVKSNRKEIVIAISRISRKPEFIIGKAKIKILTPDLFSVDFSSNFMPIPMQKTYIEPTPINRPDYEDLVDSLNL